MKYLLVTSEVTYVPKNYELFIDNFLANVSTPPQALIFFKNNEIKNVPPMLGAYILGARKFAKAYFKNALKVIIKKPNWNVPVKYFNNPNDQEFIDYVKFHQIDLIINARTRFIYKKKILKAPRLGCINIHHGVLPDYRGVMCDLYALAEGRAPGFTIHQMDSKIDNGKILKVFTHQFYPSNFSDYIHFSSQHEGREMAILVNQIIKDDHIHGDPNITSSPIYTKNPSRSFIKELIKKEVLT